MSCLSIVYLYIYNNTITNLIVNINDNNRNLYQLSNQMEIPNCEAKENAKLLRNSFHLWSQVNRIPFINIGVNNKTCAGLVSSSNFNLS